MAKLHARSGLGSRYAPNPSPREIGPCTAGGCAGTLVVGVAGGATVISCPLCGELWEPARWHQLAEKLGQLVAS